MDRVRQRTQGDCGVACAAMLAAVAYEQAWAAALSFMSSAEGDIPFEQLTKVFGNLGLAATLIPAGPGDKHGSGLCQIMYIKDDEPVFHYVVWDSEQKIFLDPQNEPPDHFTIVRFIEVSK